MKRKIVFLILSMFVCVSLYADGPAFDGAFKPDSKNFPAGWAIHTWEGYNPWPKVEVVTDSATGKSAVSMTNVHGKDGGAIQTIAKFPARSGGVARIAFLAKGKGTAWSTFYLWGAKKEWNSVAPANNFTLSDNWQPHEFLVPIKNGHACETYFVTLAFGGKPGLELQVTDLQLDFQPSDILGDIRLPQRWTAFVPADQNFELEASQWGVVPGELGGAQGKRIVLNAGMLNLSTLASQAGKNAWIFSEIEVPYECEITLGTGSNSAFELRLNGEKVFDAAKGQKDAVVETDDQVKNVRLKKGKNIIALKVAQIDSDSVVKLAGPVDLRGAIKRLRIDQASASEDFNGATARCSGNPKLIKGNPTPGLLSVTGQGIFKANANQSLHITIPRSTVKFASEDRATQYTAAGLRIQHFDRADASRSNASFEIRARQGNRNAICRIISDEKSNNLTIEILAEGKKIDSFPLTLASLPADFLFGITKEGRWAFSSSSLVDSSTRYKSGVLKPFSSTVPLAFDFALNSNDQRGAEITVDNLVAGLASIDSRTGSVPFKVELLPTFDPVKAGWPLVFSDEFNGDSVDTDKWFYSPDDHKQYAKVHNGMVEITADWDKQKTKVQSVSLYSNERYGYGYYEAKVKFRMQSGWWSAFWLCTQGPSNPFTDGWEIDIYEDYYMGPAKPGEAPRCKLDHNLHVFACGTLRSWNYNSLLPGGPNDFYIVGCKWTPFEVSYYLNGRLIKSQANHSPYDSVTFDPFNHAAGFVPLHAILSGCCGRSGGDPTKGVFPESFFVDYVHVYAYPEENKPTITWKSKPKSEEIHKPGSSLHFEVDAKPSAKTGAKIKNVYLFDSGALLECKSVPPYKFDIDITNAYYSRTNFVKPGRSGIAPEFDRGTHALCAFAQDENGMVAHTQPVIEYLRRVGNSRPYLGKAQEIPGVVMLSHYDEGGKEIAYSDSTSGNGASQTFRVNESVDAGENVIGGASAGEWLKYTVHVKKTGKYKAVLRYGTPSRGQKGPRLLIDGSPVGQWETPPHKDSHWGTDTDAVLDGIELTEGEHEFVFLLQGSYNMSTITFVPQP